MNPEAWMETYRLKNLDCADCAVKIEDGVRKLPSVKSVSVDFATSSMRIDAPDMGAVTRRIRSIEPAVILARDDGQTHEEPGEKREFSLVRELAVLGAGGVVFALGLILERRLHASGLAFLEYVLFGAAYLLAGWKVLAGAAKGIIRGKVFDENFLMTVATLGAFAIHEVAEAVAVMIFYKVGEILQDYSVDKSRRSIRRLLDLRPDTARVRVNGKIVDMRPEEVAVGQQIIVRPGERVPLDGIVTSGEGFLDTSALTGESVPRRTESGGEVAAGYVSTDGSLEIRVTHLASESSAAKIIRLVEDALHSKAKTEQFISRFARLYTPIVVVAAAVIAFLPPLLNSNVHLHDSIYRALTMLVISCPCALVISIPLGYFGGVGGASRRGILVKGAVHLDTLASVRSVVFDKTGTLTRGEFRVKEIRPANGTSEESLLRYAAMAEAHSNHPIAASIRAAWGKPLNGEKVEEYRELGGLGISARVSGREVVAGNDRLMHQKNIDHAVCEVDGTVVHVAVGGAYAGFLLIGDSLKEDAAQAIKALRDRGVDQIVMLTGDSHAVAASVASSLGLDEYRADLLPGDKVSELERIMNSRKGRGSTAFVGDGINDAPVLARADIGIAMGQSGTDAAVETADVVLMTDNLQKVAEAIGRGRKTRSIVVQNIIFALGVKLAFLALGAVGVATIWEAVIADMGVALLAIANAARAMR
ncbi:MAG: cadmium-translocating P-type ATPase [Deltaproteobacteria bacterium RBG_13_65_10]|nr:MAG: cadmium-translocating P-type ATPase [Deltaproteobacteria bacterium RBG_13_65_10]